MSESSSAKKIKSAENKKRVPQRRRGAVGEQNLNAKPVLGTQNSARTENRERRRPLLKTGRPSKQVHVGYKFLERLCNGNSEFRVVDELLNNIDSFRKLVESQPSLDTVHNIMKVTAMACQTSLSGCLMPILTTLCSNSFLVHLQSLIFQISIHQEKSFEEMKNFFNSLLTFFTTVATLLPTTASEKLLVLTMASMNAAKETELRWNSKLPDVLSEFSILEGKLKSNVTSSVDTQANDRKWKLDSHMELLHAEDPPNDFRLISLYPTSEDLFGPPEFLRPNLIKGSYRSKEHYLDVQFRLLREDFMSTIREGFRVYLESGTKVRNHNLKVYLNTRVESMSLTKNDKRNRNTELHFCVRFGDEKFVKRIAWAHSKRFMHQNLLIFSKDNFQSFIMGLVWDRDEVEKGIIKVKMLSENLPRLIGEDFVMVESSTFFLPYYNVMKAFTRIDPDGKSSLDRYILGQCFDPKPPEYLVTSNIAIHPSMMNSLDPSQQAAMTAAFQNEMAAIQGPPGTGKTFLGLRIMETLVMNEHKWRKRNNEVILVVCYTNHALDQFLEGVLDFCPRIVRVGSKAKSGKLEQYNLLNLKKNRRGWKKWSSDIYNEWVNCCDALRDTDNLLSKCTANSVLIGKRAIDLVSCIDFAFKSDADLISWLICRDHEIFSASLFPLQDLRAIPKAAVRSLPNYFQIVQENIDNDAIFIGGSGSLDWCAYDLLGIKRSLARKQEEIDSLDEVDPDVIKSLMREQECFDVINYLIQVNEKLYIEDFRYRVPTSRWHLNKLSIRSRWALYFIWKQRFEDLLCSSIMALHAKYIRLGQQLDEIHALEDVEVVKDSKALIVGITTTRAASCIPFLNGIRPVIVVAEEAAEVLESHLFIAITKHCQHLIMIGDHEQLRPNPASYKLATEYNLNVSLFERMVIGSGNVHSLTVQHRMRPAIAKLVCPMIYPTLVNHESVLLYPSITGVAHNLFFLDHTFPESIFEDIDSYQNVKEAELMVAFSRHLILQGYSPEDVTLLTTYSGQVICISKLMKRCALLKDVRVTCVDNFQGEESKIILLSLVRNNNDGNIGFLKIKNRICVALSRAKHGFYIFGNMSCLKKGSELWQQVDFTLQKQEAVGPFLSLICPIHNRTNIVSQAKGFDKLMEGGCDLMCNTEMNCGHYCPQLCHVIDRTHDQIICKQRCLKTCHLGHNCSELCGRPCPKCEVHVRWDLSCGHSQFAPCHVNDEVKCQTIVEVKLGACGHNTKKRCFQEETEVNCPSPCDVRLDCGHSCERSCHRYADPDHLKYECKKPCPKKNPNCTNSQAHDCQKQCFEDCGPCSVREMKQLPCGHRLKLECWNYVNDILCAKDCKKMLSCGHKCKKKCHEICKCEQKVKKLSPCGHEIDTICFKKVDPSDCKAQCKRTLTCGHRCKARCNEDCTKYRCNELVRTPKPAECGHVIDSLPCYMMELFRPGDVTSNQAVILKFCQHPCLTELSCKDVCQGKCGECTQRRIHVPCSAPCGNTLVCGHKCKSPCREDCPPCQEPCFYKCKHSECKKKCGEPCVDCKEQCSWSCVHYQCSQKCGQVCDRPPCNEPCPNLLPCGHPCVGLCGEKCPQLCRKCNKDVLTEIFFGSEDEEDARFIELEDCGHVIEVDALDTWMKERELNRSGNSAILLKTCPRCKTPIVMSKRYSSEILTTFQNIMKVKVKLYGDIKAVAAKQKSLQERALQVFNVENSLSEVSALPEMQCLVNRVAEELKPTKVVKKGSKKIDQRNTVQGMPHYRKLEFIIEFVDSTLKNLKQVKLGELKSWLSTRMFNHISLLCGKLCDIDKLNYSQLNSIKNEVVRLNHMCYLAYLMKYDTSTDSRNKILNLAQSVFLVEGYSSARQTQNYQNFKELESYFKKMRSVVTAEEFKMVQDAMSVNFTGSKQGHWFACKNGHPYCITECGGAMQRANCPECGSTIGGTGHRLDESNRLASFIDNARSPAWPQ